MDKAAHADADDEHDRDFVVRSSIVVRGGGLLTTTPHKKAAIIRTSPHEVVTIGTWRSTRGVYPTDGGTTRRTAAIAWVVTVVPRIGLRLLLVVLTTYLRLLRERDRKIGVIRNGAWRRRRRLRAWWGRPRRRRRCRGGDDELVPPIRTNDAALPLGAGSHHRHQRSGGSSLLHWRRWRRSRGGRLPRRCRCCQCHPDRQVGGSDGTRWRGRPRPARGWAARSYCRCHCHRCCVRRISRGGCRDCCRRLGKRPGGGRSWLRRVCP